MICTTCNTPNPVTAFACTACASPLATAVPDVASQVLASGCRLQNGLFTVGRVLGQGGFGITYLGSDTHLQRPVAVKEFFPQGCVRQNQTVRPSGGLSPADFQESRTRFVEEARTLARFQHSGIVQVYSTFEENNTAYMVMECLKGKTLARLIEEHGTLPEREAIGYAEKVGQALAVVHEAKLLHRDIKPDNLIVTEDGRVVLLDFGTAREFAAGRTRRMTAMLTPGYAPLEQYGQQARFGMFTDVYALGATFYHALTGQLPVQATDRAAGVSLLPPHRWNPSISRQVSEAVMWALEMRVDRRPQSVVEFIGALCGAAQPTGAPRGKKRAGAQSGPPPPPNPYEARIRQLADQLAQPEPPAPPTPHDAQIQQIETRLRGLDNFRLNVHLCPACRRAGLTHVTGQPTGQCPLCQKAPLHDRAVELNKCPECRSPRFQEHRLADDLSFCPVCQIAPLVKERRKQWGLALDLWWKCPHCTTELDVKTGGKATLVSVGLQGDPHGLQQHVGETRSIAEWRLLSTRSAHFYRCEDCDLQLDVRDTGMTLVHSGRKPPVAPDRRGQTLPRRAWARVANGLPSDAGDRFCVCCRAEFDVEPEKKALTLRSVSAGSRWDQSWLGRTMPISCWHLAAAGKTSLRPGLLCRTCRIEFDDDGGKLRLVRAPSQLLTSHVNHTASLEDWHRLSVGVPTVGEEQHLRTQLIRLQELVRALLAPHRERVAQSRRSLEEELVRVCKQSFIEGHIPLTSALCRIALKNGEALRCELPVLRLKQRTYQGCPYWDTDVQGNLAITSERLLFEAPGAAPWQRSHGKLYSADLAYVQGLSLPVLTLLYEGLQKAVGFAVPESSFQLTVNGVATQVSLTAHDVLGMLRRARH
ncbi:MAG: serine/threonine protein kinase [Armatimonadota bacterium]